MSRRLHSGGISRTRVTHPRGAAASRVLPDAPSAPPALQTSQGVSWEPSELGTSAQHGASISQAVVFH